MSRDGTGVSGHDAASQSARRACRRAAVIWSIVTVMVGVFSAVYQSFSHGVRSWWMMSLAAWPLFLGAVVWVVFAWSRRWPAPDEGIRVLHACGLATV
ncbi:MAG: hypothetical protein LBV00_05125, partial [Propionibacteriaceae bacterium]|nr:hypothetical protein [Propionibacteriaceae bacterium]